MRVSFLACKPIYHKFPILSWLIRAAQGMIGWSHFVMVVDEEYSFDSTSKDSRFWSMDEINERYEVVKRLDFNIDVDFLTMFRWTIKHANKKYAKMQILGIVLKLALRLIRVKINNPFGKNAGMLICCELLVLWLRDWKGVAIGDSDDYDLVEAWSLGEKNVR